MIECHVSIMNDDEIEVFLQTLTIKDLKDVITEYKGVKGISNYHKGELIEAFTNLLSEIDQKKAYEKWMPRKIQENIERATNMLSRWKNAEFFLDDHNKEYIVDITWPGGEKDHCEVKLENNDVKHACNCKLGEYGGICVHLVGIIALLYLKKKLTLDQVPFLIEESWLAPVLAMQDEIMSNLADPSEADIDLNEYWIFIRGEKITSKWTGDYAGIKTVDIGGLNANTKTPTSVEEWVVTKVVDKQLEHLRNTGKVREIITDKFGVIDKILTNNKQLKRLQTAFKRAAEKFGHESYPQTPEEIRKALRIGLIE